MLVPARLFLKAWLADIAPAGTNLAGVLVVDSTVASGS